MADRRVRFSVDRERVDATFRVIASSDDGRRGRRA